MVWNRSPRSMGEGQGRGECPLVLAFMVCPAHAAESSPGGSESPCLPWHSTPSGHGRWLSLKTEGGLSRTWHRGSLSSGIRVSLISGNDLRPYSRHMWVFSPCWSSSSPTNNPRYTLPKTQLHTHTHTHPSSLTRLQ